MQSSGDINHTLVSNCMRFLHYSHVGKLIMLSYWTRIKEVLSLTGPITELLHLFENLDLTS